MSRASSISIRTNPPRFSGGFTLLEMLVATTVLVVILVLFAQITSNTMTVTQISNRQMDVSTQARTVFDRLSENMDGLVRTGGMTVVVVKNGYGYNDAIAFLSNTRGLKLSLSGTIPRCTAVGFKMGDSKDPAISQGTVPVPMLNWGTGMAFWTGSLYSNLTTAATSIAGTAAPTPSTANSSLGYRPLAPNIFRFEISFLLDNGVIVTTPPRDINFPTITGSSYPVALSRDASEDQLSTGAGWHDSSDGYLASNYTPPDKNDPTTWRYVKAFIVGMAGVSSDVRQLIPVGQMSTLANTLSDPGFSTSPTTPTPLEAWDFTDSATVAPNATIIRSSLAPPAFPQSVLTNLYIYQRYYYIN